MRLLLEGAACVKANVNAKSKKGRTALHWAAIVLEAVSRWCCCFWRAPGGQKANINAMNDEGGTALHLAALQGRWASDGGHEAVLRLLLKGAGGQKADINAMDDKGRGYCDAFRC